MKVLIVLAVLVAVALAGQKRYDGYQVYEVQARDEAGYKALVRIAMESDNYDFWTEPRGMDRAVDVMVPPAFAAPFVAALNAFNIHYRVKIPNVQEVIEESLSEMAPPGKAVDFTEYYDYQTTMDFIDELAAKYPNLMSVNKTFKSYADRVMPLVTIKGRNTGRNKAVFVDGGIHAREWISPSFTTWLINELVANYSAHPQFVDDVDWYIMPIINPDGYAFTHQSVGGDRLWRKNRAPNAGSTCIGTDLNRNFGFHWNEGGSSAVPCSDTYHGGSAFSQIESRNVRDAINAANRNGDVTTYLTFHSYGQYFLYPWGYTSALPDDVAELDALAKAGSAALEKLYGTKYTIGSSTNVLYVASGGSDDWAKGLGGVKFSYTLEMRDTGTFGFQLPARQIIPNNLETWEAVKVVANNVMAQKRSIKRH